MTRKARQEAPTIAPVVVVVLLLYGVLIAVVWSRGLFDLDSTKSDARVVAAVVTLLGGLFTASLTLVGALLKHSIDQRNITLAREAEDRLKIESERNARLADEAEARLKLESERNARLADEAEARLRLETSIRAVELLSTDSGRPAPQTRQAGALFTLSALGQLELALSLLRETWPKGGVSSMTATHVIDRALLSDTRTTQMDAALILHDNAALLTSDPSLSLEFPPCITFDWPLSIQPSARHAAFRALCDCFLARPVNNWAEGFLDFLLLQLDLVRTRDPDDNNSADAALVLHTLLDSDIDWGGTLENPFDADHRLTIESLRAESDARGYAPTQEGDKFSRRFAEWGRTPT